MIIAGHGLCLAQTSGNSAYSQQGGKARAKQNEQNKRAAAQQESPPVVVRAQGEAMALTPAAPNVSIEASVLMNLKADEYVAVFGVSQECATVPECNQKMDAAANRFAEELK